MIPHLQGHVLEWRVRQLMAAAGIRSAAELHRRLKEVDPDCVQFVQFCKIVKRAPALINSRTLLGLALVFGCEIGDIVRIREARHELP